MSGASDPDEQVLRLAAEELIVGRREVETDHVRVRTVTEEVPVQRVLDVVRSRVDIERVAVDRAVEVAPGPREEDGVLIVPIVEERLVVEKRLFVVEEIRIRRRDVIDRVSVDETLRRQRAVIDRDLPSSSGGPND